MQESEPALRHYAQILQRQAWLVVLMPILTVGLMFVFLAVKDPVYRASTTIVVGEPGEGAPELATSSTMQTMTSLIEGGGVTRHVIANLRLDISREEFKKNLTVELLPDTATLDVSYESTDPRLALAVISEMARMFNRQIGQKLGVQQAGERSSRAGSFKLIVRVFDPPHLDPRPIPTNRGTNFLLAAVAGLALGLMLAVARDSLDFRVRGRPEAEEWFGAPVVGALPKGGRSSGPVPVDGAGLGGRSEATRAASLELLRARLQFAQTGIAGPTIVVTSAGPQEGKSNVAASLGVALARSGKRVICVDADLRRPTLPSWLGVNEDGPGLIDILESRAGFDGVLLKVELPSNGDGPSETGSRLEVLPAGTTSTASSGVLTPEAVTGLVEQLLELADYIVFDSPPLIAADSFPLAQRSDSVLVVARSGRTTKDQAESARATLEGLGVEKISVVLTDAPATDSYYV